MGLPHTLRNKIRPRAAGRARPRRAAAAAQPLFRAGPALRLLGRMLSVLPAQQDAGRGAAGPGAVRGLRSAAGAAAPRTEPGPGQLRRLRGSAGAAGAAQGAGGAAAAVVDQRRWWISDSGGGSAAAVVVDQQQQQQQQVPRAGSGSAGRGRGAAVPRAAGRSARRGGCRGCWSSPGGGHGRHMRGRLPRPRARRAPPGSAQAAWGSGGPAGSAQLGWRHITQRLSHDRGVLRRWNGP